MDTHFDPVESSLGLGQLTNIGKHQLYELGKWLRTRYGNDSLLDDQHKDNQIFIRSSRVKRTIESADNMLKGLYHNKTENITIHTMSENDDYLIAVNVPKDCTFYYEKFKKLFETEEFHVLHEKYQCAFDYLSEHTGYPINSSETWAAIKYTHKVESTLTSRKYVTKK